MIAVGFGVDDKTGQKYWVSKNSWGTGWGEEGYVRFEKGVNTCQMAECPVIPLGVYPT